MTKNRKVDQWVTDNQNKHQCICGCGQFIVITRNHAKNGIPKTIFGHAGRKSPPKYRYLRAGERDIWVDENQGKHRCRCGCDELVIVTRKHYNHGIPLYIHGHYQRSVIRPSDEERYWERTEKTGHNGCWMWIGAKNSLGYGLIKTDNKVVGRFAHRLAYFIRNGAFDRSLDVLHACDHPWCVNPDHLFLGTHSDNMKDAAKKGRLRRKYIEKDVIEAVRLRRLGVRNCDVSRMTGISPSDICAIMKGITWSFVTGIKRKV